MLLVAVAHAAVCTYDYSVWSTRTAAVSRTVHVEKPAEELTDAERDPSGCTPCAEDQQAVTLSNGVSFPLCQRYADSVRDALDQAIEAGFRVVTVTGWRPGMSRGPTNEAGERTVLSNHSFGVAIDVNEAANGLYDTCVTWAPTCRLRKGGPWRPGQDPLSIVRDSVLVRAMTAAGLRWGGELEGRQKDFMHFSPTGS